MSSIAKQTSSVMQENKELRADRTELQNNHSVELNRVNERYSIEIDKLKGSHINLEEHHNIKMDSLRASNEKLQKSMNLKDKELFEVTHTLTRCKEEQKRIEVKAEEQQKKLEEIASKYNKLLGKIEILEQLEKKYNNDMRKR